jgi:hypothetical protein
VLLIRLEIWYVQGFVLLTGFLPNSEIALDSLSVWYGSPYPPSLDLHYYYTSYLIH